METAKSEVFLCKYYGTTTTSLNILDTTLIFFDPSPSGFSVALLQKYWFNFFIDLDFIFF